MSTIEVPLSSSAPVSGLLPPRSEEYAAALAQHRPELKAEAHGREGDAEEGQVAVEAALPLVLRERKHETGGEAAGVGVVVDAGALRPNKRRLRSLTGAACARARRCKAVVMRLGRGVRASAPEVVGGDYRLENLGGRPGEEARAEADRATQSMAAEVQARLMPSPGSPATTGEAGERRSVAVAPEAGQGVREWSG
jgi:hypothetical protein